MTNQVHPPGPPRHVTGKRGQLRDHVVQLLVDRHEESLEGLEALLVARHQARRGPGQRCASERVYVIEGGNMAGDWLK